MSMFSDLMSGGYTSDTEKTQLKKHITDLWNKVNQLETKLAQTQHELDHLREKTNTNVTKIVAKIKEIENDD